MGLGDIVILLILAVIFFGPEDLPDVARVVGKVVYEIRTYTNGITQEFQNALNETSKPTVEAKPALPETEEVLETFEESKRSSGDNEAADHNQNDEISSMDVLELINKICNNQNGFSISYDFIINSREFKRIISLGENALEKMLERFRNTKSDGLEEYVMAMACSEIMYQEMDLQLASGREWFNINFVS